MQGAGRGPRSRDPGVTPWAEGGAKPLRPPGCPLLTVLGCGGAATMNNWKWLASKRLWGRAGKRAVPGMGRLLGFLSNRMKTQYGSPPTPNFCSAAYKCIDI